MESIGERLRRRREELGLSIEQAAEATKFRPELIEAVEESRAGVFSAEVYRDGFIRTYAGLLNLDGDLLLRNQKTEEERAHEAIRGLKVRPARSPVSPKVLAGVLALVVVGIVAAVLIGRTGKGNDAVKRQDGALQSSEADSTAGSRGRARRMRHVAAAKAPDSVLSPPAVGSGVTDTARTGVRVQTDRPGESPQAEVGGQVAEPGEGGQSLMGGRVAGPSEGGQSVIGGQVSGPSARGQSTVGGEVAVPRESKQPPVGVQTPGAERAGPERTGPDRTAPAERTEPQVTEQAPPVPGGSPAQTGGGMRTLEIVASRSANLTIKSGERIILNDYWLRRGERVTRTDTGPFFIVTLSDRQGVSITLDGKPVRLPLSDSPELFDWPIPSDR